MARSRVWVSTLLACFVLAPVCRAEDAPADPLAASGATKTGTLYVLPAEKDVIDGMRTLRQQKAKLDQDLRLRAQYEQKIAADKQFLKQCEAEHTLMEEKLATVSDPTIHNQIVGKMNLLYVKAKEAQKQQTELEEKSSKIAIQAKADFVDKMTAIDTKAEEARKKYTDLGADPDVKAALDKINETARPHLKLGPTSAFVAATNQLKVWRKQTEAETIPLYEESGVHMVDVLLNGKPFRMVLDTGASAISLPSELAATLKMVPGPKDPTVEVSIADGSVVEGRMMTLDTVRVGRFTVKSVKCIIMPPSSRKVPALLGGTFLSHFVAKVDPQESVLHLIGLSPSDKMLSTSGDKNDKPANPGKKNPAKSDDQ
ncbi:MAG TPA: retroviral-like aspartic protease family protein [Tepidisphaeraceae bacterium]|nr:retroviral-like aspartic protease family protein [Tepidisphaeraceae bacterium]